MDNLEFIFIIIEMVAIIIQIGVESMNILINLRDFLEDVLLEIEGE